MCKLTLVTGIPAVSTKMTVEHRGKENKGRQGTGCKAPHAGFCTGIAGIKFLLEAVCSASRQRTVGKRHKGVKQLGFPLLQHEPGEWNPILSPSLLTQTLASKPQHNSSQADWTQPEDPAEPQNLCLCCMLDLIYTKHMTQEPVLPIVTSIKPLKPALLSPVNRFHAFIKWMY